MIGRALVLGRRAVRASLALRNARSFSSRRFGDEHLPLSPLTAISGVDGRYESKTKELREYFSEYALIKNRVIVELEWLRKVAAIKEIKEVPALNADSLALIASLEDEFCEEDAQEVKDIEAVTNHDVKAVEYFLRSKFSSSRELRDITHFLHFALTSEDVNNLAYGRMIKGARDKFLLPLGRSLIDELEGWATEYADACMLARTHGQPATPTTFGKEMANFAYRLKRQHKGIADVEILGKANGAVGNFNAHVAAYPNVDWLMHAEDFVKSMGLEFNPYCTQIEPHDFIAELFHAVTRFNTILMDFDRDVWAYISLGYLKQRVVDAEVGSSTMPHKVNPIAFENSEGNLGYANAIMQHLSEKLPISRFQRDLTDSTVLRSIGVGFAHCAIAYRSTLQGMSRLDVRRDYMREELDDNWELLAEPVQTVMRRYSIDAPYEKLKAFTRGQRVTKESMHEFVASLHELPQDAKDDLLAMTPMNYLGLAPQLARGVAGRE